MNKDKDPLTDKVIGSAIEVHKSLGPGLLESAYEECFYYELGQNKIAFNRHAPLPVLYKSVKLNCGYRMDIVVDERLIVELKTVEKILPVHEAQLLTYLKLSGLSTALLLNFNTAVLKDGIRKIVH